MTKLDFPPPDIPVTQIRFPIGNLTFTFFKLFSHAFITFMN